LQLDADFIVTKSIDMSATASWNSGSGFTPIGVVAPYFTGVFDGDSRSISRFFSNTGGLFKFVTGAGTHLKNVVLTDAHIVGVEVGILAGNVSSGALVSNCLTSGFIDSQGDSGGLVGRLYENAIIE